MKFVDKLLKETDFLQQLQKLEQLEKNRQFCRHGLNHLLDTARIAWITYLEQLRGVDKETGQEQVAESADLEKEMIYLAALLHDLGRIREYEDGISHHVASADFAEKYLAQVNYPVENAKIIVSAVYGHRKKQEQSPQGTEKLCESGNSSEAYRKKSDCLRELLYFADKKSRNCFGCEAAEACNWEQERRNMRIVI